MNLVKFPAEGKFVFVGDTHGYLDASKQIIQKYADPDTKICFLGDYVDRGEQSKENIDYLLKIRKNHQSRIVLLQGNHENYLHLPFSPADFWENLDSANQKKYQNIFDKFPLVLSVGNIIALHGVLPSVNNLEDINKIELLSPEWKVILWGDFMANGIYSGNSRPTFSKDYFNRTMKDLGKKLLIRSHQPDSPLSIFDKRCLTIFTSPSSYRSIKTIAIADFTKNKNIRTIDDLIIEEVH